VEIEADRCISKRRSYNPSARDRDRCNTPRAKTYFEGGDDDVPGLQLALQVSQQLEQVAPAQLHFGVALRPEKKRETWWLAKEAGGEGRSPLGSCCPPPTAFCSLAAGRNNAPHSATIVAAAAALVADQRREIISFDTFSSARHAHSDRPSFVPACLPRLPHTSAIFGTASSI